MQFNLFTAVFDYADYDSIRLRNDLDTRIQIKQHWLYFRLKIKGSQNLVCTSSLVLMHR